MWTNAKSVLNFMFAGNATLTLRSTVSGSHYTYKINEAPKRNPNDAPAYFVKLLTGPDNTNDFQYMGLITNNQFLLRGKTKFSADSAAVKAFSWSLASFVKGQIPAHLEVYHQGRCGRCGRPLTVPESIATGIGPDCAAQMGIDQVSLPLQSTPPAPKVQTAEEAALIQRMVAFTRTVTPEVYYKNLQGDTMTDGAAYSFWTRLYSEKPLEDDRFWGDEFGRQEAIQEEAAERASMAAEEALYEHSCDRNSSGDNF